MYNREVVRLWHEGEQVINIFTLLHSDKTVSTLRITPENGGFSLHVDLGPGKVLHDLMIQRPEGDDAA